LGPEPGGRRQNQADRQESAPDPPPAFHHGFPEVLQEDLFHEGDQVERVVDFREGIFLAWAIFVNRPSLSLSLVTIR